MILIFVDIVIFGKGVRVSIGGSLGYRKVAVGGTGSTRFSLVHTSSPVSKVFSILTSDVFSRLSRNIVIFWKVSCFIQSRLYLGIFKRIWQVHCEMIFKLTLGSHDLDIQKKCVKSTIDRCGSPMQATGSLSQKKYIVGAVNLEYHRKIVTE